MSFLTELSKQHHDCDVALTEVERAAFDDRWTDAQEAMEAFIDQTEQHFEYEEKVLFPALTRANPMVGEPVTVMQSEHAQMRELIGDLRIAVDEHRSDLLAGASETLMFLLTQHNAKEESVLYPIADQTLEHTDLKARDPS